MTVWHADEWRGLDGWLCVAVGIRITQQARQLWIPVPSVTTQRLPSGVMRTTYAVVGTEQTLRGGK
jgi:hypothetical protein